MLVERIDRLHAAREDAGEVRELRGSPSVAADDFSAVAPPVRASPAAAASSYVPADAVAPPVGEEPVRGRLGGCAQTLALPLQRVRVQPPAREPVAVLVDPVSHDLRRRLRVELDAQMSALCERERGPLAARDLGRPGGTVNASSCQVSHGPAGTSGSPDSILAPEDLRDRQRRHRAAQGLGEQRAPRQMPSTGTSSATQRRR